MALVFVALPILILIFLINLCLQKRGKKHLPEMLALPVGLFFIMCYIAYELKIGFLAVFIIFFFGMIIGSLTEHILAQERGKK